MIPILYDPTATVFTSNGLGALSDAIECKVDEERNGAYTLTMVYPVDGQHYGDLTISSLIKAYCGDRRQAQLFRVYKITRPMAGRVTVEANHLSYQLSSIPCTPFTASAVGTALSGLVANAAETCPFSFWTNKSTVATYTQTVPASIRSRLGGTQGSILDVYGGEWEFDNYDVKLWAARGSDNGVTLRYGKNIIDLTQETNIENTYTGVCPFWTNGDTTVTLPEKVVSSPAAANFPYPHTVALDCSQAFRDVPTEAQLRTYASNYVNRAGVGVPKVAVKVEFVNLRDTEEYKEVAALERVELCDYVTVIYDRLGVNAKAEVTKTSWDVLAERYISIDIGDLRASLAQTIAETKEEAGEAVDSSALTSAVQKATDIIKGVTGGYIKWVTDADGHPYEMLIMDTDSEATATYIWRYNSAGWAFSRDGGSTYTTAATLDGGIVADFITAGTLTGLTINNGSGTFYVDSAGNVTANSLTSNNATITGGSMTITTGDDSTTPLVITGTYTTTTPNTTSEHVYMVSISRKGVKVEDNTWTYFTVDGKPQYPTSRSVSEYNYSGASYTSYSGNGTAPPTVNSQFARSDNSGFTAANSSGDSAILGTVPIDANAGFYVRRSSMVRPVVALDEIGVRWYDSSNTLIGQLTPTDAAKVTALGTLTTGTASSSVSVPSSSWTSVASIAHGVGTYIVTAYYSIASNASGYRTLLLTTSNTGSTPITTQARARVAAANGTETSVSITTIIEATSSGAWYMRAYQTSGSTLSIASSEIRIVRIA